VAITAAGEIVSLLVRIGKGMLRLRMGDEGVRKPGRVSGCQTPLGGELGGTWVYHCRVEVVKWKKTGDSRLNL